jgi:hypothetical protein
VVISAAFCIVSLIRFYSPTGRGVDHDDGGLAGVPLSKVKLKEKA